MKLTISLSIPCLLICAAAATAQEPVPASAPARGPVAFAPPLPLSTAHYRSRRAALMAAVGDGIVVIRGAGKPMDMGAFEQDQAFLYLTGVSEPDLALVLNASTGEEELLVPPFNRFAATWEGSYMVPGEAAAARTGFQKVGNVRALRRRLEELLAEEDGKRPVLWTLLLPAPGPTNTGGQARGAAARIEKDPLDGRTWREAAFGKRLEESFPGLEVRDVTGAIDQLRWVKTPGEVAQLRAAAEIGAHGLAEVIKSTRPGMYEYQLQAIARYVYTRFGAGPDAYGAIVGSGPNGCILHYMANSRRIADGDLIVMDYGPTFRGYATDITRTFPANGKFTAEQRELVQDICEVQQALVAEVKPGARLSQLSRLCRKLLSERGYRTDHGPCHHVGLAVHDPSTDVLEPGMVITVEPGAYLRGAGMGCRIEDTVLVTENGCANLSGHLPASPDAIEALMAQRGVHDRPVGLPPR